MKIRSVLAAGLVVGTLGWAGRAAADDTSALEGVLEEQVVTAASRSPERATTAPAVSRTISAEELRRYGIRSLAEALSFLAMGIRSEVGISGPEVGARGMMVTGDKNNHVLVLIDGHIINEPLFGGVSVGQELGVPLELVDHIEVILGPGSVVYGSNAMMAVINVVTKSASTLGGAQVAVESSLLTDGRVTATGGHAFDLFGKSTEVAAGMMLYGRDGPSFQVGPQVIGNDKDGAPLRTSGSGPATGVWGGTIKRANYEEVAGAQVRVSRDRLDVMIRATTTRRGEPWFGYTGDLDFDEPRARTLQKRGSVSVGYRFPLGSVGELTTRGYLDLYANEFHPVISRQSACAFGATTCDFVSVGKSRRLGADVNAALDWSHDGRLVTQLGSVANANATDLYVDAVDADTGRSLFPRVTQLDAQNFVVAANAQQSWQPLSWLGLNAGARIDKDDRFPAVVSPRAVVALSPWEGGTLRGILSEAFRAPSYAESAHEPVVIANPDLVPERVISHEVAFEQRVGVHRATFAFFDTDYQGGISKVQLTQGEAAAAIAAGLSPLPYTPQVVLFQLRNTGIDVETFGFSAALDGTVAQRFHYGVSFTGASAEQERSTGITHVVIPVAPRAFGNARAAYDLGGGWPTLAVATTFASKAIVDRGLDGGFAPTPYGPPQLELRGTVTGDVPRINGLSYRIIVSQTLNPYAPYAIGPGVHPLPNQPEPELLPVQRFSTTLGLQYAF